MANFIFYFIFLRTLLYSYLYNRPCPVYFLFCSVENNIAFIFSEIHYVAGPPTSSSLKPSELPWEEKRSSMRVRIASVMSSHLLCFFFYFLFFFFGGGDFIFKKHFLKIKSIMYCLLLQLKLFRTFRKNIQYFILLNYSIFFLFQLSRVTYLCKDNIFVPLD